MKFDYVVGLFNWKNGRVKLLACFADEKHAKDYAFLKDGYELFMYSILFVRFPDGSFEFLTDTDNKLRSDSPERWKSFDKSRVFDASNDEVVWLYDCASLNELKDNFALVYDE